MENGHSGPDFLPALAVAVSLLVLAPELASEGLLVKKAVMVQP